MPGRSHPVHWPGTSCLPSVSGPICRRWLRLPTAPGVRSSRDWLSSRRPQYVVTKLKVGAARKLREEADAKAKEAAAKAEEELQKKAKEAGE